jgi:hypothetical protein
VETGDGSDEGCSVGVTDGACDGAAVAVGAVGERLATSPVGEAIAATVISGGTSDGWFVAASVVTVVAAAMASVGTVCATDASSAETCTSMDAASIGATKRCSGAVEFDEESEFSV